MNVIVPENNAMIYVIQMAYAAKPFIQWAVHEHTEHAEEILKSAEYALFQRTKTSYYPLAGFVAGQKIFGMGSTLIGETGIYKEF